MKIYNQSLKINYQGMKIYFQGLKIILNNVLGCFFCRLRMFFLPYRRLLYAKAPTFRNAGALYT